MSQHGIERICFCAFLALSACGGGEDVGTQTPTAEVPSFSSDVIPALSACVTCHSDGAGGWVYDGGSGSYDAVLSKVNTSSPETSLLLTKATGQSHGGGSIFAADSAEYQTILDWITAGAPNN